LNYTSNSGQGKDAVLAYKAGHTVAMEIAKLAGEAKTEDEKSKLLKNAYIHEGKRHYREYKSQN
jgi:hypothetical protein